MRLRSELSLRLLPIFVALSALSTNVSASGINEQALLTGLSPAQAALLQRLESQSQPQVQNQPQAQNMSLLLQSRRRPVRILDMTPSQETTFTAITHALEHTRLADGTNALSLVEAVTKVNGSIPGERAPHQFNMSVIWRADAVTKLQQIGFEERVGWGHTSLWGMSYKSLPVGLHVLFSKTDNRIGSIHIDYRNFGVYVWRGRPEGHFGLSDANVMAVGPDLDGKTGKPISNLKRHEEWYGPIPGLSQN